MKRISKVLIITLLITITVATPASAFTTNERATGWYNMIVYDLSSTGKVYYIYRDLTGDGIYEAITESKTSKNGSGRTVNIYTFRDNTPVTILSDSIYGLSKVYIYKANQSLIIYASGHGHSEYYYYKLINGFYSKVAYRSHKYGKKWKYYNFYGQQITKKKFNAIVKTVKKGSKKTISFEKFKVSEAQD